MAIERHYSELAGIPIWQKEGKIFTGTTYRSAQMRGPYARIAVERFRLRSVGDILRLNNRSFMNYSGAVAAKRELANFLAEVADAHGFYSPLRPGQVKQKLLDRAREKERLVSEQAFGDCLTVIERGLKLKGEGWQAEVLSLPDLSRRTVHVRPGLRRFIAEESLGLPLDKVEVSDAIEFEEIDNGVKIYFVDQVELRSAFQAFIDGEGCFERRSGLAGLNNWLPLIKPAEYKSRFVDPLTRWALARVAEPGECMRITLSLPRLRGKLISPSFQQKTRNLLTELSAHLRLGAYWQGHLVGKIMADWVDSRSSIQAYSARREAERFCNVMSELTVLPDVYPAQWNHRAFADASILSLNGLETKPVPFVYIP
ncbi:MAG: hypothetical protein ABIE84_00010 [bacterium]